MKKVLEAFRLWFTAQTSLPTALEPNKLEAPEPSLRLMLAGFEAQGADREKLTLEATLAASGDGPDVFLEAVLEASRAMLPYREGVFSFPVEAGFSATATFSRTAPGRFQQNEGQGEGGPRYSFAYLEPFRVELSYNPAKL